MQKAAQAASKFISGDGKHKQSVERTTGAPVVEEHVRPHRHEEVTTAVDKEIHQDHYRTIVQPLQQKEAREETHTHNAMPVEHKTFDHRNTDETRSKLNSEAEQFQNASTTHETTHSHNAKPTLTGEHVHHHLHEHVQPVITKEVVDPTVVHTTKPIHETHHLESVHHSSTVLPVKTVDEFTRSGGMLEGHSGTQNKHHEGATQRPYEGTHMTSTTGGERGVLNEGNTTHQTRGLGQADHTTAKTAAVTAAAGSHSTDSANTRTTRSTSGNSSKPSLMAKLNPFSDADGDGKKGLMD